MQRKLREDPYTFTPLASRDTCWSRCQSSPNDSPWFGRGSCKEQAWQQQGSRPRYPPCECNNTELSVHTQQPIRRIIPPQPHPPGLHVHRHVANRRCNQKKKSSISGTYVANEPYIQLMKFACAAAHVCSTHQPSSGCRQVQLATSGTSS